MLAGDVFHVELDGNSAAVNAALRRGEVSTTQFIDMFLEKSDTELQTRKEDAVPTVIRGKLFSKTTSPETLPEVHMAKGYVHPTLLEWWCLLRDHPKLTSVQAFFLERRGQSSFSSCSIPFVHEEGGGHRLGFEEIEPLIFLIQEGETAASLRS